jgi:hypothetical protein
MAKPMVLRRYQLTSTRPLFRGSVVSARQDPQSPSIILANGARGYYFPSLGHNTENTLRKHLIVKHHLQKDRTRRRVPRR